MHSPHRTWIIRTGRFASLCFAGMLGWTLTAAAATDPAMLTIERLFNDKEFDGEKFGEIRWSKLSSTYFTFSSEAGGLIQTDLRTGEGTALVPAAALVPEGEKVPLTVDGFELSADEAKVLIYTNSQRVWRHNTRGDYWLLDVASRELKKLGDDAEPATMMFAKFSPDGTRVAYVRANNLHVQDLDTMAITTLTTDGSASLINGTSDWANEEELGIRDGYRWSPDGHSIAFWQFDTTGVTQFHLLNNTVSKSQEIISFPYPKVGETNSATRLGVIPAKGGDTTWLKIPGDPRAHYLPHVEWTPDGSRLLVQQFNRLQTENRLMLANPETGEVTPVLTESDDAWLENDNPVRWGNEGKAIVWLSERSGWRHAYLASLDGQSFSPITEGDSDVIAIEAVDADGGWLYYAASPESATQRHLYRTRMEGGTSERLSPEAQAGWHSYDISADTKWAVHTYSSFTSPPVVELVSLPDHRVVRVLVSNEELREKLAALKRPAVDFLKVEIDGGLSLDAWCIKPPEMDEAAVSKYPVLVHVYGEPHGQTVKDAWPGSRGLWHWMLAQQGCIVTSIDNRGTYVPRGRAWRKSVHRQIGILAPQEQAAAVRGLLKSWPFADPARVGVWGWSGGGSMSLHAIFRYPDLYRTAIAVAPNADQLLYDSIYQERYMGLPGDNAENYRIGSPIAHADQLEGNLLLVHGTGDDNGHFQGTEMLMNKLIAHGKHFTVMPYPNRTHSIKEGPNTVPHFMGLLTRYLQENLINAAAKPN